MLPRDNHVRVLVMLVVVLFLGGAGCGNTVPTAPPEEAPQTVVKQPDGASTIDYAISVCEDRGYTAVLKYDETTKQTKTYCDFNTGYACEAIAFLTGACTSTTTNRLYLPSTDGLPDNLRTCSNDEIPVCGKNGITYSHSCIAALQRVDILHTGVCTPEEQEAAAAIATTQAQTGSSSGSGSGSTGTSGGSTGSSSGSGSTNTSGNVAWLSHVSAIAGKNLSGGSAPTIESCTYGKTTVYYSVEHCPDCFSTLYSSTGKVICHPHNDIAGECPSYFNKDNRAGNCIKI